ncbi:hypothetical protein ScPMuIL_018547 [Solemya velum]
MAAILSQHLSRIKTPLGGEKVFKDECIFSFDTPETETGLYVCMNTFIGVGKKHLERYHRKTGNSVFLHLKRTRKEIPKPEINMPEAKPTKIAIGVEGGFHPGEKQYEFEESNSITVLPDWTEIPLPNPDLPDTVQLSIALILAADDALKAEEAAAMAGTWDGEKRIVSKHAANLKQLENVGKIPPSGWKLEHYNRCGYPLAVKLGTITAEGGDVYSYDEDDMVEDPHLAEHLAHLTDKTMIELEIDINQKFGEWDIIQEAGSKLQPVYGPNHTGMRNLGNSCYMNSVMQVLFTLPEFQRSYCGNVGDIAENAPPDPLSDFNFQMTKLGNG